MEWLTKEQAQQAYNNGKILQNRQNDKYITTFKLLWMHFSSNPNRRKAYGFNNKHWCIIEGGFIAKLMMPNMHRLKSK